MGFLQETAAQYRAWSPHTWWGDYTDVRFRMVEEISRLRGKVLDIGCNTGFMVSRATAAVVHGLDVRADYIAEARHRHPSGDFRQGSFEAIPWPARSFDAVILCHVLEIPDSADGRRRVLREAVRVLADTGVLLFSTPNNDHPFYCHRKATGHGVTRAELQELLSESGLVGQVALWNPIPTLVSLLPRKVLDRGPRPWWPYLGCPSRLVSFFPRIYDFLKLWTDGNCQAFRALWGTARKSPQGNEGARV